MAATTASPSAWGPAKSGSSVPMMSRAGHLTVGSRAAAAGLAVAAPQRGLRTQGSQARAVIGIQAVQEFLRDVEEHGQVRFCELPGDHFLEHAPIGLPG